MKFSEKNIEKTLKIQFFDLQDREFWKNNIAIGFPAKFYLYACQILIDLLHFNEKPDFGI